MTAISKDGFFLTPEAIRAIRSDETFKATLKTAWGNLRGRLFHRCTVASEPYIADAVTGTMYRPDGSSASGGPMSVTNIPRSLVNRESMMAVLQGMKRVLADEVVGGAT